MSDSFAQGLLGITLDGRYRLDAVLGEGGMGSVFRATQLAMDRKVAVKLLKPHLTSDQVALERFNREARATLRVESPHAVKVLDFGVTPQRDYYMVLEYLDGRTVQRELEIDGVFAPVRVAHIARQALEALGVAHAQGLIHRDIKPDNLLLMRSGGDGDFTKVLDFGVAKLMQGAAGDHLALTAAGMVFGTPEFMSPEQACGQPLDGRSDLYSLAATMFAMLTGTPLFEGATAIEWLTHHVRTPAPQLAMARPELAAYPELDALIQRCLAKPRDQRPDSAAEMARQLAELTPTLTRSPANAPPRPPSKPTQVHSSSYFAVFGAGGPPLTAPVSAAPASAIAAPPSAIAAPASAIAAPPSAIAAPVAQRAARPAVDAMAPVAQLVLPRKRRRGALWLAGGGAAALIGLVVGLAMQGGSPSASQVEASPAASVPTPTPTPIAAPPSAGTRPPSADPAPATPPLPQHAPPRPLPRPVSAARNPEADAHLRAAEDALRDGKALRQLAEADAALRADPRSARAKYLLGDALIKSGDLENGCRYLGELKRIPSARSRARAAGCPGD